jgi:hypothetical protein
MGVSLPPRNSLSPPMCGEQATVTARVRGLTNLTTILTAATINLKSLLGDYAGTAAPGPHMPRTPSTGATVKAPTSAPGAFPFASRPVTRIQVRGATDV